MASDKERGVWKWMEREKGRVWMSSLLPADDACCAKVQRSFTQSAGKWRYYAYRDMRAIGVFDSAEKAKEACEKWKRGAKQKALDPVLVYVDNYQRDVKAFLALTPAQQAQVRSTYPYAAPHENKVLRALGIEPEVPEDAKLHARKVRGEKPFDDEARMARAKPGNPKAPGTSSHARWERCLQHCDRGATVAQFLEAGGNYTTLKNAVKKGYAKVVEK